VAWSCAEPGACFPDPLRCPISLGQTAASNSQAPVQPCGRGQEDPSSNTSRSTPQLGPGPNLGAKTINPRRCRRFGGPGGQGTHDAGKAGRHSPCTGTDDRQDTGPPRKPRLRPPSGQPIRPPKPRGVHHRRGRRRQRERTGLGSLGACKNECEHTDTLRKELQTVVRELAAMNKASRTILEAGPGGVLI